MAIYFPGKISNQESLFLSWNNPSVNPTEFGGQGGGGTSLTLIKPQALQAVH